MASFGVIRQEYPALPAPGAPPPFFGVKFTRKRRNISFLSNHLLSTGRGTRLGYRHANKLSKLTYPGAPNVPGTCRGGTRQSRWCTWRRRCCWPAWTWGLRSHKSTLFVKKTSATVSGPDNVVDPLVRIILLFSSLADKMPTKVKFFSKFFGLLRYFLKVHLHHSSKIKSQKEVTNCRNQGLSNFFCLLMERSGSVKIVTNPDSGGTKTYGSYGSGYTTGSS